VRRIGKACGLFDYDAERREKVSIEERCRNHHNKVMNGDGRLVGPRGDNGGSPRRKDRTIQPPGQGSSRKETGREQERSPEATTYRSSNRRMLVCRRRGRTFLVVLLSKKGDGRGKKNVLAVPPDVKIGTKTDGGPRRKVPRHEILSRR